jgi:FkbM family methyltransferase
LNLGGLRNLLKRAALRIGVDVRSARHTEDKIMQALMYRLRPSVVLDVGANVGQYARKLRVLGFRGLIISFEALAVAHARLVDAAAGDAHWLAAPRAVVGSETGTTAINVAGNSVSSSVLPMTSLLLDAVPNVVYVATEQVPGIRLDAVAEIPQQGSLMLKIDTQGYELEVLRGATTLFQRISLLQLELSLVPLYEGAPVMTDIIAYLGSHGFDLFQLIPAFRDERDGRLLQVEGFFVRRTSHLPVTVPES